MRFRCGSHGAAVVCTLVSESLSEFPGSPVIRDLRLVTRHSSGGWGQVHVSAGLVPRGLTGRLCPPPAGPGGFWHLWVPWLATPPPRPSIRLHAVFSPCACLCASVPTGWGPPCSSMTSSRLVTPATAPTLERAHSEVLGGGFPTCELSGGTVRPTAEPKA